MTLEEFIEFLKLKSKDDFITLWVYCMDGIDAKTQITVEEAYENFYEAFTEYNGCTTIDEFIVAGHECDELEIIGE